VPPLDAAGSQGTDIREVAGHEAASHVVACHFWKEIGTTAPGVSAARANARLERLQAFFRPRVA
jgi:hypothetical protein